MKLMILMFAVVGLAFGRSYYETGDDYVDVDSIIAHLPSLQSYVDCYLDIAPCTPLAQSFKDVIPDCIRRGCDKCNFPQKQGFGRFILGLKIRLPYKYYWFRQKYDPLNIHFDKLEAELSKYWNYKKRAQRPPSYHSSYNYVTN